MTRWNPNDPSVVGPEFLGVSSSTHKLAGLLQWVGQRFRSNAAETIAAVRLHTGITSFGNIPAAYIVEVHAAGQELDDGVLTTVTYAPNQLDIIGDQAVTGHIVGAAGPGHIDEWPPNGKDWVQMAPAASFDLQFASAAVAPTGRIAAVAVELVTNFGQVTLGHPTASDPRRRTVVSLHVGADLFGTQVRTIPNNNNGNTGGRLFVNWGEINPITGLPWTAADVADFDVGTFVRIARQPGDAGTWQLSAARLIVSYENTERRLARGVFTTTTPGDPGWTSNIPLASPAGVANWAKANATDYALSIRLANIGGATPFGANWLDLSTVQAAAGELAPADLDGSYDGTSDAVTVINDGSLVLAQTPSGEATAVPGRLLAFVFRTTTPATSADSQPYSSVRKAGVWTGRVNEGELRTSVTDDYAGLRITAGWFLGVPTAPLVVQLRRRSDSVLMATFTFTADEVLATGATSGELVVLEAKLPEPGISLTSGVQYYLSISSATGSDATWIVGVLAVQAIVGGVLYQEGTYGGGTDVADPINSTAATSLSLTPADFAAVLDAAVDKPTTFTADDELLALPDEQPCELDGIPYVQMTWASTALGGDFARYEIDRLAPDGETWEQIAAIEDESVNYFADIEARLGVQESYRIRVVRTDGASSYYSPTFSATAPAAGCGYTFSTNDAPELAVGYPDTYRGRPTRTYQFPEASEVTYRRMYGRDNQVAFKPLSRRGVTFDRHLVIGGLAAPAAGVGPPAADALRNLAWATVPYVCVRDQHGNRWYASIRVPDLEATNYLETVHIHEVNISVVEVASAPAVADAQAPLPGVDPGLPGPDDDDTYHELYTETY